MAMRFAKNKLLKNNESQTNYYVVTRPSGSGRLKTSPVYSIVVFLNSTTQINGPYSKAFDWTISTDREHSKEMAGQFRLIDLTRNNYTGLFHFVDIARNYLVGQFALDTVDSVRNEIYLGNFN